jgi:MFS family permease
MRFRDVAATYVLWSGLRAAVHRGYWSVASLYLVVEADLSAFQLVFVGTAQGLTALLFEVPTGVMADTISRKWSIATAHLVVGASMLATGLVTAFPALVMTQMLWGLGWTFSSGADVAWLTDELDQPERTGSVLVASARWQQIGATVGMLAVGALAWAQVSSSPAPERTARLRAQRERPTPRSSRSPSAPAPAVSGATPLRKSEKARTVP